jgi:hypothetical protein
MDTEAISNLLATTEQAHGVFESTELNGVYDREWARWYAAFAVDHGIGELVGHAVTADQVARVLASTFVEFRNTEPKPTESWAAWTARRITEEL